jgi:hypothetical protein
MTYKVEGVHGEFVSLVIVFRGAIVDVGAPEKIQSRPRVSLHEIPSEFLQVFHAGFFREERARIDNLLRNVRHESVRERCGLRAASAVAVGRYLEVWGYWGLQ